jgi:hypothetical protein
MKRLGALLLTLIGLAAVLGSCGGEEDETATLAVAFRLDEGSPVMVAYIGDPAEDPFELPAGRYYIEALDADDVLLSLGAVEIEDGGVVEFPASFEAAGGVADREQAEPLITMASFLIDVELAELTFWEIVTGGFSESPFDPAVELDEADFLGLIDMYGEIATQEDDVLGALDKIEGRAEVSFRTPYVASPWAAGDGLKRVRLQLLVLFTELAVYGAKEAERGWSGEATADVFSIAIIGAAQETGAHTYAERKTPQKSERLLDEEKQWQEYAKWLLEDYEMSPSEARPLVETRIKSDVLREFADLSEEEADAFAKIFVKEVAKAVPELAEEAAPAVAEPEEAEEPEEPEEPEEEEPSEPGLPAEERQLRAEGLKDQDSYAAPNCVLEKNEMWLEFSSGGGTVTGEGRIEYRCAVNPACERNYWWGKWHYKGTYSPDSEALKKGVERGSFSGTWTYEYDYTDYVTEKCVPVSANVPVRSDNWQATLENGVVRGSHMPGAPIDIVLTVQGQ